MEKCSTLFWKIISNNNKLTFCFESGGNMRVIFTPFRIPLSDGHARIVRNLIKTGILNISFGIRPNSLKNNGIFISSKTRWNTYMKNSINSWAIQSIIEQFNPSGPASTILCRTVRYQYCDSNLLWQGYQVNIKHLCIHLIPLFT